MSDDATAVMGGPVDDVETFPSPENGSSSPAPDPEAPFGRKANGEPYKRDPARYRKRSERARGRSGPSSRKSSSSSSRRTSSLRDARADAAKGLLGLIVAPLTILGVVSDPFAADAAALEQTGPGIAEALADAAETHTVIASGLDRLADVGPGLAIAAAVSPLIFQVAANHGLVRPGFMGTVDPRALAELQRERFRAAAEAASPAPAPAVA